MSKKLIALMMAALMLLSVAAACSSDTPSDATPTDPPSATGTTPPATTPTQPATTTPEPDPDADKYGGDLIIGSSNAVATMDIHQANGILGPVQIGMHIYENLATIDANGKVYGEICDYEASADGLTYTFTLKERYFSNGDKITMEDIEASIRRQIALGITSEESYNKNFQGSTWTFEEDKLTVSFEKLNLNFINTIANGLGQYKIMPKEICDKYPYTGGTETPEGFVYGATGNMINEVEDVIGSGPYCLTKFSETEIVVARNENYEIITEGNEDAIGICAPRKAYCDTITWSINTDAASRTAATINHDYHIGSVQSAMVDAALAAGLEKYDAGTSWTHGIFFNLDETNADSPVADVNVRKAIRAAIDVNAVLLAIVGGDQSRVNLDPYAVTNNTVYASTMMEDSGEWNIHDVEKAKEYLAQSSYNGEPIVYLTHASGNFYNAAMAIIPMLEEIGLNIEFMPVDNGSHSAMRKDPATGHDIGCWEVQKREENPVLHSTFVTGSQGWWESDAKNAALDVMKSTPTGSAESIAAYEDYLQAVIDECPYILFGHPTGLGWKWPEIEKGSVGQTGYFWNDYFTE